MSTLKFSVVIPTCRRLDLLVRCLESLRPENQLVAADSYEVIVTDDAREQTAEGMIRGQFPWARWVQGPSRGPAANRNNGAREAKGKWLCFIDDDCVASKEWITALVNASADETIDLIEGKTTIPDKTDNPFLHAVSNHTGGAYWSCNLAVRRETFISLGGFDENFLEAHSEDMEFAHRFHAHNFRSKFDPEALIYHPVRAVHWRTIWNRIWMIRWAALYQYKTDQHLHLSDSPARNVLRAFVGTLLDQLRIMWHELKDWDFSCWKSRCFALALRWITFPLVLPYYLYWVYRFHRLLSVTPREAGLGSVQSKAP